MDIAEIRLQNVDHVITSKCRGVKAEFARIIGKEPQVIARWWASAPSQKRNIGARTARKIEEIFKLPKGWMDNHHPSAYELEDDGLKKLELMMRAGETYKIPLTHQITLDPQLTITFLAKTKGLVMLLSTDQNVYALQLLGHNPDIYLTEGWAIIVEPNTHLAPNEFALLKLDTGELLLRQIVHIKPGQLVVRNPVTREQATLPYDRIAQAEYAYIGIPPSKVRLLENNDSESE